MTTSEEGNEEILFLLYKQTIFFLFLTDFFYFWKPFLTQ